MGLFCCNSAPDDQIASNFCTCHNSTAVVACAKFCSNHFIKNWMRAKQNFHRIWIMMELSWLVWSPECVLLFAGRIASKWKRQEQMSFVNLNSVWLSTLRFKFLKDSWCISLIQGTWLFYRFLPLFMFLYITQVLPVIYLLKWFTLK